MYTLPVGQVTYGGGPRRDTEQADPNAHTVDLESAGTQADRDAQLYAANCGSCHYIGPEDIRSRRSGFEDKSAIYFSDPSDLIRVILYGIDRQNGDPLQIMPAFGSTLSDSDIARIAAYLRRTRTTEAPWADLEKTVTALREHATTT